MAGGLGAVILGNGFNWLYFALMGLLTMALGMFGSVFNTYASVYLPKDNEQLLSLPLDPWEILRAKINMSVQLNVYSSIFFILVCGTVLRFHWWETALICVAVWFYIWAVSDFELFLNLKNPNFSWTNVAYVTKESMPVVISMFGGWAFCIALGFGGFFLAKIAPVWAVLCTYILLLLILGLALHRWLKKKGTEIFASL